MMGGAIADPVPHSRTGRGGHKSHREAPYSTDNGIHGDWEIPPDPNTTTALVIARSEATKQSRFTAANCQPGTRFFAPFGRSE